MAGSWTTPPGGPTPTTKSPSTPCTGSPTPTTPTSPCRCAPATDAGKVFDALLERGDIVIHPTEVQRQATVAGLAAATPGDLVIADTREQVAGLNATIRDHHRTTTTDDDDAQER